MCGEHLFWQMAGNGFEGSSPHVRGAPYRRSSVCLPHGIIPACAGSTCRVGFQPLPIGDHPRMCGEHRSDIDGMTEAAGSSPHVRGAQTEVLCLGGDGGIIPACAGSTVPGNRLVGVVGDHPRMCGEHWVFRFCLDGEPGSSPHVRGALYVNGSLMPILGIIPACAGSTDNGFHYSTLPGDHPRMCGEHFNAVRSATSPQGSSPHVRGAPHHINHGATQLGIIPACAGSTWLCGTCPDADRDHPRMCGEHVLWSRPATSAEGSSPHVRGARRGFQQSTD